MDIFDQLRQGGPVSVQDPAFAAVNEVVLQTISLCAKLNQSGDLSTVRQLLSEITGQAIDASTTIFPPFYTNFGRFIQLGKHIFINHDCSFLDLGGIILEDHVLIGPKVKLITENHPLEPAQRRDLLTQPILIKKNAWIGAGATILPGVTIGENAVVAAGAVVTKNVPDNTVVGGIPAQLIKKIV
ncbi:MAG: DapH/DapD/GlmU-related protein [Chitinophagales bacterium]|jgi:acetyltransferase-like isoleucine patch superfamily enzyme